MNAQEFRARVRAERRKRGWTQSDLEKASGVKKRNITSFENGHTNLQPVNERRIREALDLWDDMPADDEAVAEATRAKWDKDITLTLDVIGQVLSTLEDEERQAVMSDLIRSLMGRARGNQSA
jgi:transcriptional regulator with XRE-family HTH domain